MSIRNDVPMGNALLVANYPSDVGYAWWLMENFWVEISKIMHERGRKAFLAYPSVTEIPESIRSAPIGVVELKFADASSAQERALLDFVKTNCIKFVYLSDRPYRASLYKKMRRQGVEIIVNHDHSPGCATRLSKLLKVPRNAFYRRSSSACNAYIAVSRFVYEKMVDFAGLPKELCQIVQNGIPPFKENPNRIDHRKALNIPSDAFVIATVGRASVYKGIDFIIECASRLSSQEGLANVHFVYCGDGPDLKYFQSLVASKSLQTRFHCLGRRSDVREILLACDAAIHASPLEACSLSILEYMSAGLATLAPAVGGNIEQLTDKETGFFYKFRDIDDAVAKISYLYFNEAERRDVGKKASLAVAERFTLELMNERFRNHIRHIFGLGSGGTEVEQVVLQPLTSVAPQEAL